MSEVEEKTVEEEAPVPEPDMPVVPLFGKWLEICSGQLEVLR